MPSGQRRLRYINHMHGVQLNHAMRGSRCQHDKRGYES